MDIATLTALCKLLFDGLAVIIMIILFLKTNKKRQAEYDQERKEYKEMNKEIHDNYTAMIQDIVQGVSKRHLTFEESKRLIQIEKQINDAINVILKETNASRVCIVKYHNGQRDMTGMAFLKMSMTNEVVNRGVAPLMSDFKDLFRSYLAYWCHELEVNGKCIIKDTEDLQNTDINMYEYLKTRNIEAKYGVALKDLDGDVIGFLCVEYLDKREFKIENIEKIVNHQADKIETLMTLNEMGEN